MTMLEIETWPLDRLRPHPENGTIFGDPEESAEFAAICASIKASGIWEPLVVKADGTILSGHLRRAAAEKLKLKGVPVRVRGAFDSYLDEVKFVIRSNTDRRQLTKGEIGFAFKRLSQIPREQGGAKAKAGRPKKGENKSAESRGLSETRDAAAEQLGVSRDVAEACAAVFTTPGVPEELKAAVNRGKVAPTTAAKRVRAEVKRQGGEIADPSPLVAAAAEPPKRAPDTRSDHERRIQDAAEKYRARYARLVKAYGEISDVLTSMPLKSVLGPTEHHEYRSVIHDISLRAWREIESVDGPTNAGKQMALSVIQGGKGP